MEDPKEVYDALFPRVIARNNLYYETYPGDVPLVKKIVRSLIEAPAPLPSGGTLTARRFLQLGMALGGGPGSFEQVGECNERKTGGWGQSHHTKTLGVQGPHKGHRAL